MTVHNRAELEQEKRRVRRTTSGSLMSDTKWRKVFTTIKAHPELELRQCIFKFVDQDEEREAITPSGLHTPWPWIDTFSFGPIALRSIEWLLFPSTAEYRLDRTIPPRRVPQDIDALTRLLDGLGRLPFEMTERGLLIRGYISGR